MRNFIQWPLSGYFQFSSSFCPIALKNLPVQLEALTEIGSQNREKKKSISWKRASWNYFMVIMTSGLLGEKRKIEMILCDEWKGRGRQENRLFFPFLRLFYIATSFRILTSDRWNDTRASDIQNEAFRFSIIMISWDTALRHPFRGFQPFFDLFNLIQHSPLINFFTHRLYLKVNFTSFQAASFSPSLHPHPALTEYWF